MTSSLIKRTGDLILGTEPRQRLRIYRSLMAASVYLICIGLQGYACIIGFMHWSDAILLSGLIVLNVLFWYGVLRSGINQRFADPALTLPQILSALTVIAGAYAVTGPVHGSTLMLLALVLVFGIFNMKAPDAKLAGIYTVLLMGLTMLIKSQSEAVHYPIHLEIAHFVLVAAIVPTISSLAAQLSNLRAKLQNQKEELTQALNRIQVLATRDELTGLYNRRHMMDVLNQHQKRLNRSGHHRFCLAIIDIDFFKRINDTYGHNVGDEVLRNFAQAAATVMRETDVVARWGGEEFLVLLNDTQPGAAAIGLERLRDHLRNVQLAANLPDLKPTFSAGLTDYALSEPLHSCIERADRALYAAKNGGRDRVVMVNGTDQGGHQAQENGHPMAVA
ncbi:MAG: GGDEF domain-containing protein [Aquabacterium sp.]|jgi:diguanylate cyclase|uniref:GGDEF domain-containing protein n=1 Tax=Aquabacterium sp. TaxID=1872578 RepID=UPI003BB0AB81